MVLPSQWWFLLLFLDKICSIKDMICQWWWVECNLSFPSWMLLWWTNLIQWRWWICKTNKTLQWADSSCLLLWIQWCLIKLNSKPHQWEEICHKLRQGWHWLLLRQIHRVTRWRKSSWLTFWFLITHRKWITL